MSNQGNVSTLVLLVGSNPLPNYLTACALQPAQVVLFYTDETKDAKDRLDVVLRRVLHGITIEDVRVPDATSSTEMRRVIDPWVRYRNEVVHLNYTGGTKVMAAHARLAFYEAQGRKASGNASYLDEGGACREPRLRFDDGNSQALAAYPNMPLDLATVLALHGITHKPREPKRPAPASEDAREILCKVLSHPGLADKLYCESKRLEKQSWKKAIEQSFRATDYDLKLSLPEFPTNEQLSQLTSRKEKESWFKQWYKFIGGEWLEEWLGERIRTLGLTPTPEVTIGFDAFRGLQAAQLEIDVAVIRGHRSYFISCTTDQTKPVCKSKLFEVAVRSRQLGGDLARAALVCLADDNVVKALQNDVDDLWGASNTTKVFGLSEVRQWSGCDSTQPDCYSLKQWLES
jgi:hypothetical protein